MAEFNYDAFISYRRSDGIGVARWLRRELEGFRAPRSLRSMFGRKLRVYLDTAYERGTSDFYEQSIRPALLSSRFLLVVATPNAMRRPSDAEDWIEREVSDFAMVPNSRNVIAIRGVGEFDAPLPADLRQRFPNIEIVDLRGASRLWFLHPTRAVRLASEKLKLVAPLLGIPPEEMPRLRQEEEKRQQSRLGGIAGATLGVLVSVSGLSVFALQSRNQAIRAAEDSMFAAGGMALQAAALDTGNAATARVRRLIINRGCDLVDKFRHGAVSEPQIGDTVMCRVERAGEHERLHEHEKARRQFGDAIELSSVRHERLARIDAGLGLLQARQAYAEYFLRQKDAAAAEAEYSRLLEESRRLGKEHEGHGEFVQSEAEALEQLGDIQAGRRDLAKSGANYDAAAAAVGRLLEAKVLENRDPAPEKIAWFARLHRLAGQQQMQLGNADQAADRFRNSLAARALNGSEQLPPSIEHEMAVTQAIMFAFEIQRGNAAAAEIAKNEALGSVDLITKSTRASRDLKERAADLKRWIEAQDANK